MATKNNQANFSDYVTRLYRDWETVYLQIGRAHV